MNFKNEKEKFLIQEFASSSIIAGLATRNHEFPIYKSANDDNKTKLKKEIKNFLINLFFKVRDRSLDNKDEISDYWKELSDKLSKENSVFLKNHRFRLGISQKIVSLFLKYLYCSNFISNLCVCPIDGIIRNKIESETKFKLEKWTEIDKIEDLERYFEEINRIRGDKTIIDWEIEVWNKI